MIIVYIIYNLVEETKIFSAMTRITWDKIIDRCLSQLPITPITTNLTNVVFGGLREQQLNIWYFLAWHAFNMWINKISSHVFTSQVDPDFFLKKNSFQIGLFVNYFNNMLSPTGINTTLWLRASNLFIDQVSPKNHQNHQKRDQSTCSLYN